ncbi:hypothetical protein BJAS_P3453 [Bathymodiolus japonicus methanotrophic gill symbiont]|uniref:hypothetical protein n=1 Tax=Bathymodiolus japonicus methanotrophic gill symbiont TaxID=113269 RepID=UPI001B455B72|nr:hypothetical protein [Bathymodiolus japonicus methanotrophic gill symbiont]GFO72916.1 hypothetical protein BJAS_P3453 [Bathymodiolus japonicus methanotrophic gill symbiont]
MAEYAAIIIAAVSAAASVGAAASSAVQQNKSAKHNADMQRKLATEKENANVRAKASLRLKMKQQLSTQRATAAAKGVSLDSDTSLSIFEGTELSNQFEEEQLDYNTASQASSLRSNAGLARFEGRNNAISTGISGGGKFLADGYTVGSKWYNKTKSK